MKCAVCDQRASPRFANSAGPLCFFTSARAEGRNKHGSYRGNHARVAKDLKRTYRQYLKALLPAVDHGKRKGKRTKENKRQWEAEMIAYFASLENLDGVTDEAKVRGGPCDGMAAGRAVEAYKRFTILRRRLAGDRKMCDQATWDAWVARCLPWETEDYWRWGADAIHTTFWPRRDAGDTRERAEEAVDAEAVSSSSDSSGDDSDGMLCDDPEAAAVGSTAWWAWQADSSWWDEAGDADSAWQSAAGAGEMWCEEGEAEDVTRLPDLSDIPVVIEFGPTAKRGGDGGCSAFRWRLDEDPCRDLPDDPLRILQLDETLGEHCRPQELGGAFVWDHRAQKPEPHNRRAEGASPARCVRGSRPADLQPLLSDGFRPGSWNNTRRRAQIELLEWHRMRPEFTGKFDEMAVVDMTRWDPDFPNVGTCLHLCRKDRADFMLHTPLDGTVLGVHATSPYCVRRIVATDSLDVGLGAVREGGRVPKGACFHLLSRAGLCQATSSHYVAFGSEGWLCAPFVTILVKLRARSAMMARSFCLWRGAVQKTLMANC